MLTNIIRGGQLFLHAVRMFRQVFKFLVYITFVVALAVYSIKAYFTITGEEIWAVYDFYRAKALTECWLGETKLQTHYHTIIAEFNSSSIPRVSYFIERKDLFFSKLAYCGFFTMKIVAVLFVALTILLVRRGLKKSGVKFNRGAKIGRFEETRKTILKHNKSRKYKSYTLAGMPYPYYSEMEHTLVVGSTGVGKTVLISDLVEQIRKRGDKAIIYDKKCDYISWFYNKSKDFILNPFDTRGSKWNLLAEIEHIAHLKSLSQAFIADSPGNIDKIWDEAGRIAFSGILEKFLIQGEELTNREIVDRILRQDLKSLEELVKGTYAQALMGSDSPKITASVLFVLASSLNSLRLTQGKREDSFSIRKWLRDDKRDSILFVSSEQTLSKELSPLITAWFEIAISGILSQSQNLDRKTWIILDELPTLNRIPSLSQGLSVARSYGGCFVLGIQNIAQMREIYGKNTTEDISSECNTRCIFKTNDPDTARWMAQNLGEEDITEFKEGVSYGANTMRDGININEHNRIRSIILPSEIQHMKKLNLLVKMPDYPAAKTELKFKQRELPEKPFINDDKLIGELQEIDKIITEAEEASSREDLASSKEGAELKANTFSKLDNKKKKPMAEIKKIKSKKTSSNSSKTSASNKFKNQEPIEKQLI